LKSINFIEHLDDYGEGYTVADRWKVEIM